MQYVAARTASVARNAAEVGLTRGDADASTPRCSPTTRSTTCSRRSASSRPWWPPPPSCASRTGSPATWRSWPATYHRFYDTCRVLPRGDEEITDLHRARLWLNDATRTVIANGLALLGVSAPERM